MLSYAVSFVLGTALFGGGGYLLFKAKADELALDREKLDFSLFAKEDLAAYDMAGFWKSDRTSQTEPLTLLEPVVKRLSDTVTAPRLDDGFARETAVWADESVSHIAAQIGGVTGYTFSEELYKNLQQDYAGELESEKNLLTDVAESVTDWNQLSVERRRDRLGQIFRKGLGVKTKLAQIESRSVRVLKRIDEKKAANDQKFNELRNQITANARKRLFARIGVTAGLALVLFSVGGYFFTKWKT
jgi:hypothetical protein